jgi:aspartyl-tRNA synthetase
MGQLFFVVLRDHTGTVQATFEKHEIEGHEEIFSKIQQHMDQLSADELIQNDPQNKHGLYGQNVVSTQTQLSPPDSTTTTTTTTTNNSTIIRGETDIDFNTVGTTAYETGMSLGAEYVVSIKGVLQQRPADMIKKTQQLGSKEVRIRSLRLLNTSKPLPVSLHDEFELTNEDSRMKFRFVDLRREFNQYVIKLRSQLTMQARMAMYLLGFHEIETPYLVKSTPEGAREFLVPARAPGKFYALPQSPQQFKQLLMCGGFDKYFQIARCFRDESGRQDRQPEFTQLDLELSFTTPDHVMKSVETMVNAMHLQTYGVPMKPLKKLRFIDVMNRFGSDKPDIRFSSELNDITSYFVNHALQHNIVDINPTNNTNNHNNDTTTINETTLTEQQQNIVKDETLGNLLKIYPSFLHAHQGLQQTGDYEHFSLDNVNTNNNNNNENENKNNKNTEIKLKIPILNQTTGEKQYKIKPLARHPFPVVKMMIARDLNDVLSKGKNKDKMDKILRDCKESSQGLLPVIISVNKMNKIKPTQTILNQPQIQQKLITDFNLQSNDMLFVLAGDWENVCNGLGKIRLNLKSLLKQGNEELLPAIIDGERIQPPQRLNKQQEQPDDINLNPFTRFNDYLIPADWKQQHTTFFDQSTPDKTSSEHSSSSSLFSNRKVLNEVGPLPTFHWVVDFPLFEPVIPTSLYQKQHDLKQKSKTSTESTESTAAAAAAAAAAATTTTSNTANLDQVISLNAMHHPFTAPNPEDMDEFNDIMIKFNSKIKIDPITNQPLISQNNLPVQTNNDEISGYPLDLITVSQQLAQIRALHYDLVSNGLEVGGGSIRLHNPTIQRQIFDLLQVPHDKFSHLLNALELGAPPHGGFAAGLDRLVAIFGSQHPQGDPLKLKDVIAFPKSSTGTDLLLGTPNEQTNDQLNEYFIQPIIPPQKEKEEQDVK